MPEEIKENEINILDLVSVLLKNIKWITLITIIGMILIVIISVTSLLLPPQKSFLPNEYTPKSTVLINSSSGTNDLSSVLASSGLGSLAGLAGISSGSSGISDSALAIRLVTTDSFIQKLNTKFSLDDIYETKELDHPKTELKKLINGKLKIALAEPSGMLEISYTDINKVLATDIVNTVTDLLEIEFAEIDKIRNRDQFSVVEDKKAIVEREMKRLQDEIIRFQLNHNILNVNVVSQEIVKLVSELQSQLLSKEVEIESYGKFANERDPNYIKLLNEKEAILKAISKLENGEVGDYPPIRDIPKLALELEELKRQHDVQLIGYKALIQQSETLKLTAEGTGSTFQVLEYAEVPEIKSGPSRGKLCIMVAFASFFLSIFFVFVKEAIINIKNDPDKMARLRGKDD